ncbi:MAG: transcriptional regulator [Bifidobacteriaceae bacterium]|jgi:DNA-binding MarR family transcriptional regulator|nr:transcriptional regulator [Bifidobacteriaceae bacterium]
MSGPDLDPVIHPASRLRIITALASLPPGHAMAFTALRAQLGMTVGNLSTHLTRLEAARYVEVAKTFEGKRPATRVTLTPVGWNALERYLTHLNELLGGIG